MMKKLLTILLISSLFSAYGADEKIVASLSGNLNKPIRSSSGNQASLSVQDQYYSFMQANTNWPSKFLLASKKSRVVLRYDDSKRLSPNEKWGLQVSYNIITRDENGQQLNNLSGEVLEIFYNPLEGIKYNDIALKEYPGALKTDVKITCVKYIHFATDAANSVTDFTGVSCSSAASPLPISLNDVYFDVEQVTERYYQLDAALNSNRPSVHYRNGFTATSPLPNNELPLSWTFVPGAETYDLEWLFIDAPSKDIQAGAFVDVVLANSTAAFDFTNATRINVSDNFYNIPMAFPSGILLYRVRAVGYRIEQISGVWEKSPVNALWSNFDYPASGTNQFTETGSLSSIGTDAKWRYNFTTGLENNLNWQYASTFAEEGKHKEVINYFDGSLHGRQTVTLTNSNNNAIVAETKYDYEGRPAAQIIPTPLSSQGIKFYSNFAPGFNKTLFDKQSNVNSPAPLGSADEANKYYGTNTTVTGTEAYIPDAQGYAYTRTRYKNDGTGRLRAQSGAGTDHKLGSGHETKYFYGSPDAQDELDELFGNEVGIKKHYQKNMVVDANGQVSVSYLDQEGRTIATCLGGNNPANLMPVDNRPAQPAAKTVDILNGNDILNTDQELVTTNALIVSANQTYTFEYTYASTPYCDACIQLNNSVTCETCKYDLDIKISDEDGNPVALTGISGTCAGNNQSITPPVYNLQCKNVSNAQYTFSAPLSIGQYTVTKVLRVSETGVLAAAQDYVNNQNLYHTCVHIPLMQPESCDYSCASMCEQQFKKVDPTTGAITYYDENGSSTNAGGSPYTITDFQAFLAACTTACNNQNGHLPSECEIREKILKADMSPGGQYFDNTFDKYTYVNGQLTTNLNYNKDGWFDGLPNPSTTLTALTTDINVKRPNGTPAYTFATFNDIRSNWQPWFAEVTVKHHPEYWLHNQMCNGTICGSIKIDNISDFDQAMNLLATDAAAAAGGYFNLSGETVSSTNAASDLTNGNTTYCPYTAPTSGNDPLIGCNQSALWCTEGSSNTFKNAMQHYFTNFLQVGSNSYLSIWYVLDDPLNIHSATFNNGQYNLPGSNSSVQVDASLVQLFQNLHGSATTTGLFNSAPNAKIKFYQSVYKFYKDFWFYKLYKKMNPNAFLHDNGNGYTVAHDANNVIEDHFQIRIKSPFEYITADSNTFCAPYSQQVFNISNLITNNNTTINTQCQTDCEAHADEWINTIKPLCTSLSNTVLAEIRQQLIDLCTTVCSVDPSLATPASGCNPATNSNCTQTVFITINSANTTVPNTNINCYSFDDVLAAYGCSTVHIVYPAPANNPVECACTALSSYINQQAQGQTVTSTVLQQIADDLNAQYNYTSNDPNFYTATTVATIQQWCNQAKADLLSYTSESQLPTNFPADLKCVPHNNTYNPASCVCQNIFNFYTNFGFHEADFLSQGNGAANNIAILTSHLNDAFGILPQTTYNSQLTPITTQNVSNWLNQCSSASPQLSVILSNNLPQQLQCPGLGSNPTNEDVLQAAAMAQCMTQSLEQAIKNSATAYFNLLKTKTSEYETRYREYCINHATQTFTQNYFNYLFLYTLYYYDQAGNLVKTVPPEGVQNLTGSQITQVQTYRDHGTGQPLYNAHRLVTHYKFNSLQQLIEQTTPDGGLSYFWYDAKGRMVISQNAKQRARAHSPYNAAPYLSNNQSYSYTLYDALGRISEVGEIDHPQQMNYDISRHPYTANDPNNSISNDLITWLDINGASGNAAIHKFQVTTTYYEDALNNTINNYFGAAGQQNLRNRVATTTYEDVQDYNPATYQSASHFNYDIHGNVNTLITENNNLKTSNYSGTTKRTDYEYDLVSGKVNAVHYQDGARDQFHHRYQYDADNRITAVYSSRNKAIWEKEAKYFYYRHGPLARAEIGDKQVTGNDYVYTIQGWIKAVNGDHLDAGYDPGSDAQTRDTYTLAAKYKNLHRNVATDATAYSLAYFHGDYVPKNPNLRPVDLVDTYGYNSTMLQDVQSGAGYTSSANLFNGNISRMTTALSNTNQAAMTTQSRLYFYDQLNRIKVAKDYELSNVYIWGPKEAVDANLKDNYFENFNYDYNGNITGLERWGINATNGQRTKMDQLSYKYMLDPANQKLANNKLMNVNDENGLSGNYADDIDNQSGHLQTFIVPGSNPVIDYDLEVNYEYDEIGNLVKDHSEKIADIDWTVYGKIKRITRIASSDKSDLEFNYDASGNRIHKIEITKVQSGSNYVPKASTEWKHTYYVRDAQGNTMAVYTYQPDAANTGQYLFNIKEQNIFGSSRLGTCSPQDNSNLLFASSLPDNKYVRTLGEKQYEISNHLGNVLNVISDKKLIKTGALYHEEVYFEASPNSSTTIANEGAASDLLIGPYATSSHCFSKGSEYKQVEFNDLISTSIFTHSQNTGTGQLVIQIIDATGTQVGWWPVNLINSVTNWATNTNNITFTNSSLNAVPANHTATAPYYATCFAWNPVSVTPLFVDNMSIDITHTGTLTEVANYQSDVISTTDYYAFGQPLPGMSFNSNSYKFGFAGKEKIDEMSVNGGDIDFDARIYDSRLGRWLSTDPLQKKYPGLSPYNYSFNSPVAFNDPDGKDGRLSITENKDGSVNISLETVVHIYGKDAQGAAAGLTKAYHDAGFDKTRSFTQNGVKYNVTIKVTYDETNRETLDQAAAAGGYNNPKNDPQSVKNAFATSDDLSASQLPNFQNGDNIMEIDGKKSWGNGAGWANGNGAIVGAGNSEKTFIHEPFHLIGFQEGYKMTPDGMAGTYDAFMTDKQKDVMGAGHGDVYETVNGKEVARPNIYVSAYHYVSLINYTISHSCENSVLKNRQKFESPNEPTKEQVNAAESSEVKTTAKKTK